MTHFHVSDIRTYNTCRMKWQFSSPMRMGLGPRKPSPALWLGTVIHDVLDRYFANQRKPDKTQLLRTVLKEEIARLRTMFTEEQMAAFKPDVAELHDKAKSILDNFTLWEASHLTEYKFIATELNYELPLFTDTDDHYLAGKYDAIVEDTRDGSLWVVDYKVTGMDFDWYCQYLTLDDQPKAYVLSAQRLIPAVKGIIFILINNTPPHPPRVLKNGSLSRAKNQNTTWEQYRDALLKRGEDPAQYADMQMALKSREPVRLYPMIFSEEQLQRWLNMTRWTAKEILSKPVIRPEPGMLKCRMCSFVEPCTLMLTAGWSAAKHVLDTEFIESQYVQDARAFENGE